MKKLLFVSSLAASLAGTTLLLPSVANAGDQPKAEVAEVKNNEDATLKAVKLDAKWCSSCRAITPKMTQAKADNDFANISFSKIDYTNKDKDAFWANAATLGMEAQLREFLDGKPKTGMIILFDTKTNSIVDVITKKDSPAEMAKKLNQASA